MKNLIMGAALVSLLVAGPAFAGGDAAAGKAKSVKCKVCHGADGISKMKIYPNLKGQKAPYLVEQLKAFRDKSRTGGKSKMMIPHAIKLTDADINNLAAYYSGLGN